MMHSLRLSCIYVIIGNIGLVDLKDILNINKSYSDIFFEDHWKLIKATVRHENKLRETCLWTFPWILWILSWMRNIFDYINKISKWNFVFIDILWHSVFLVPRTLKRFARVQHWLFKKKRVLALYANCLINMDSFFCSNISADMHLNIKGTWKHGCRQTNKHI